MKTQINLVNGSSIVLLADPSAKWDRGVKAIKINGVEYLCKRDPKAIPGTQPEVILEDFWIGDTQFSLEAEIVERPLFNPDEHILPSIGINDAEND